MTDGVTATAATELYRLRTQADLGELSIIRKTLRRSVEQLTGAEQLAEFLNQLELAVVETATNVIRHACQCRPAKTLTHIVSIESGLLTYEIVHDGVAFESSGQNLPEEIEPAEGGMGLFIIAQCVDSVSYNEVGEGLQAIVLTKSLNKGE